jgi:stearoyl-CoA desaturase (delta-9 desaturase)
MTTSVQKKNTNILRSIVLWFDTWALQGGELDQDPRHVNWLRVLPFFAMHFACLAVFWVGWSWVAVSVAVALYVIRMFAITGFYHRYFSHRTFKTSRWTQFLFAIMGASAVQKGPLWWAAHHRHHHRHSDREADVHSPHRDSFYWSHMGWITASVNFRTRLENVRDLARFPELRFLDRFDGLVPFLLALLLFLSGAFLQNFFPALGTSGLQMLVWGFVISTVALFHGTFTINSLSHQFGKKRYDTGDESRNNWLLAIVTLGEGWHNNHHHYPAATRQGFFWWEFDPTYYMLKLLSWTGLIWDIKEVPEKVRSTANLG